jgi:hypothetical protein
MKRGKLTLTSLSETGAAQEPIAERKGSRNRDKRDNPPSLFTSWCLRRGIEGELSDVGALCGTLRIAAARGFPCRSSLFTGNYHEYVRQAE